MYGKTLELLFTAFAVNCECMDDVSVGNEALDDCLDFYRGYLIQVRRRDQLVHSLKMVGFGLRNQESQRT